MITKQKNASAADLHLLATLVAKHLRDDRPDVAAPTLADFEVSPSSRFHASGMELHVNVRIRRGIVVRVDDIWFNEGYRDVGTLSNAAREIAERIGTIFERSPEFRSMLSEVESATKREIASAARSGLRYEFTSASIEPVDLIGHCEPSVLIGFTALGEGLVPEAYTFEARSAEQVVEVFEGLALEQMALTQRRAASDREGANGSIDAAVV